MEYNPNEMDNFAADEDSEKKNVAIFARVEKTEHAGGENEDEADDVDMYVKFSKPYVFEDESFEGLDMSCLEKLSTKDLGEIEKKFYKLGVTSFNPENTATYAKIVAQKATGLPIEFFDQLPLREMLKIKTRVVNFFYS